MRALADIHELTRSLAEVPALIGWLCAQLDQDEKIARAATPGPWSVMRDWPGEGFRIEAEDTFVVDVGVEDDGGVCRREDAEHMTAHDPARVLDEVAARRRIVREYLERKTLLDQAAFPDHRDVGQVEALELAVRLLAVPYAARHGYRPEWRP